jgi:FlaG/FlaF family flagellin (archaellin)
MICPGKTGNLYDSARTGARRSGGIISRQHRSRRRLGVSPVISSTIIIAITVTLGLSLWSFIQSQVNTSTQSFASATSDYVNYVNERYVIVSMAFKYDDPNIKGCPDDSKCVTVWVYNFSERDVRISRVLFGDSSANQQEIEQFKTSMENNVLKANTLASVTADLSGHGIDFAGDGNSVYYATIFTDGGASQVYYQTDK